MAPVLFTVGHSNHPIEVFLDWLHRHGVEAVADVRSRPHSRFVPHFGKERLQRLLAADGLGYVYLGQELGGKPPAGARRSGATTGGRPWEPAAPSVAPSYTARAREPAFRDGIGRLIAHAEERPTAMMCRERDPLDCHRLHLICRHLGSDRFAIRHILADGSLEAHDVTERRLVARAGRGTLPLFDQDDPLERAYDEWWERAR